MVAVAAAEHKRYFLSRLSLTWKPDSLNPPRASW